MGVIELRAGLAIGSIDVLAAARAEKRIRRYIRARVLQLDVPSGGIMRIADISAHAARLVREAIEVLRAR
jgi:hypothetical protein